MAKLKIIAIPGATRAGSYNRKLLAIAVREAEKQGASVELLDLKEANLPMYDGDLEAQGVPKAVAEFKKKIAQCGGAIIATPEYNFSIPAVLKNALDWASREPNAFKGKTIAIMGASPGGFGTVRAQLHLRQIMVELDTWVVPKPLVHVSKAHEAFDERGALKDEKTTQALQALIARFLAAASKL